jgi:glyoxylase-like metal-dependent hydrolase (beta-lactamase superfamily II)
MTPITIDTRMHGRAGITAAYLIKAGKTALVETGPKSSIEAVRDALRDNGVDRLDYIIVTHIHLDHAGAAGTLAHDFPDSAIAVHRVGAPHLADPSKLWLSAARIYGDEMDALWGGIDPVAGDRLIVLDDGDEIELGGVTLEAIDTPGHAGHHHAYFDRSSGILFAGDALGVRLQEVGTVRPATPPPEFHLENTITSIERIRELRPDQLWPTHFGPTDSGVTPMKPDEACDAAIEALRIWERWVTEARRHTDDLDAIAERVRDSARSILERDSSPEDIERMEQTTSYRMNTSGYIRYLDKYAD